ncbi:MAG: hypothetical protein LBS16_07275 [Prevotellaceae bacterium]|jgi:hypothetical protein|nr:hypothetical protein [Prevotellaceae bacterium]
MKQVLNLLKRMSIICMLLPVISSCDKEKNQIVGYWVFERANLIITVNGETHNAREEGADLSSFDIGFRGLVFMFREDNNFFGGQNGQITPAGTYTVSEDKIIIKDGITTMIMGYSVSGEKLNLIWSRATFEIAIGALPPEWYEFDDVEIIMTFVRAD